MHFTILSTQLRAELGHRVSQDAQQQFSSQTPIRWPPTRGMLMSEMHACERHAYEKQ
jgi:hypothetical protein